MKKACASSAANPAASRKAIACCSFRRSPAARYRYSRKNGCSGGIAERTMPYYALFYDVVDDFIARRGAYRDEHLRLRGEARHAGEFLPAGASPRRAEG